MEGIIGLVLLGAVVYAIYRMSRSRQEIAEVEAEVKKNVQTKVEEVKPAPVASLEPVVDKAIDDIKANMQAAHQEAFVKAVEEVAAKVEDAIVAEGKESAAELVKIAEPVVEEVKKKTRTVKAKAKAIEAVVEAKTEQLEKAVKKTRAKAKK